MTKLETELLELLHDIVAASDSNNGETLMNCIESARELLDKQDHADDFGCMHEWHTDEDNIEVCIHCSVERGEVQS
jgi:hypothetical protein